MCFRSEKRFLTPSFFWFTQKVIALSASANQLLKLRDQAEEYAALIMEELDPLNLGYIEVHAFDTAFHLDGL